MSTVSPAASSPARRQDGNWGDAHSYPYDYDGSSPYSRGHGYPGPPPPGYYGVPPHRGPPPPPPDYWPYEGHRGGAAYWGPPPPYDSYQSPERKMPPPARRILGDEHQHRSPRPPPKEETAPHPPSQHGHGSPPRGYPRGPASLHGQRNLLPPRPSHPGYPSETGPVKQEKKKGDPLSILANVSAGMTGKDNQKKARAGPGSEVRRHLPLPAPTSPLQRRPRPSPITPNQTPPETKQRSPRHEITPISSSSTSRAKFHPPTWEAEYGYGDYPLPPPPPPPPSSGPYSSRRRPYPAYGEYPGPGYHEGSSPALVENRSFDSQGDGNYREGYYPTGTPPPRGYYYEEPPTYGPYWEGAPPSSHAPYPPPRWNYGNPPESFHSEYPYEQPDESYPAHRPLPPPPTHHTAPYTYVQQPRLEEKTILRKKFSWKHFPELERFLISNRDEYLKHSNMNYTAEQKQYNNWLTERLLEVAQQHNYVFDPEDFNFVAIRDRIRCYYKSYVQTARKRGMKLPDKKKDS